MNSDDHPRWRRALRFGIVLVVSVSMIGCTSLQTVPTGGSAGGSSPEQRLLPGDRLVVSLKDGGVVEMELKTVTAEALIGMRAGDEVSVPLTSIERTERREFDAMRTTLIVLLAIAGVQLLRGFVKSISTTLGSPP